MSRRKQIEMNETEILELLEEERVAIASTLGPRGWPHSMPLWYVLHDGRIRAWTYRKSQKVKNLKRDPRVTVLVEAGDQYPELRGVQYEAEAVFFDDPDLITEHAEKLTARYVPGGGEPTPEMLATFRAQAPKRTLIQFDPVRTVSWDHRKLGGVY